MEKNSEFINGSLYLYIVYGVPAVQAGQMYGQILVSCELIIL